MADTPKTIRMPKTPRSAYDPQRPANNLLLYQVRELEKAVKQHGRSVKTKKPKTEEQVAAYMRHLNRALHQQVLLPKSMRRRPLDVPLEPAPSARKKSSARKKPKNKPARRKKAASSRTKRSRRS